MKKFVSLFLLFMLPAASSFADYQIKYQEQEKFQLVEFSGDLFSAVFHPEINEVLAQIHGQKDMVLKVGLSHGGVVSRFIWLIEKIKTECSQKKGSACRLTTVFTSSCASACTQFPLLSDYSISLPKARFLFHRTWILSSKLTLQSKADLAQNYVRQGGSADWFEANQEKLSRNDNSFYKMTKQEELESGLIDRQMASWAQFVLEY